MNKPLQAKPARGEIWSIRLDPVQGHEQAKTRPCLIVSHNKFNKSGADLVIVVPLTSKNKHIPLHIKIASTDSGLSVESFIMPEHIRALSIQRCITCVGVVPMHILLAVEEKIKLLLDFE